MTYREPLLDCLAAFEHRRRRCFVDHLQLAPLIISAFSERRTTI